MPSFEGDLHVSQRIREGWFHDIMGLDDKSKDRAVKDLDRGTMAARILAGKFPHKLEENLPPPFVVSANQDDVGRFWFNRGFLLLAGPLDIEVNNDNLIDPPYIQVEAAYSHEADLLMTGQRFPRSPKHDHNSLTGNTFEVFSFQIYTPEDYANVSSLAGLA
ncbi:MAG: hypothetical protein JWO47_776 [Candidatus Saccharibacteria bacterium]|nr:hypothetical protein [Candidatus Saccharibacteria bacterium]